MLWRSYLERLSFSEETRYDGLEAAIHLARYSFVRPLCMGRRVLDVACGEGYGSRLLADWGAQHVCGADVSEEALKQALRHFSSPNISFHHVRGEWLDAAFAGGEFDLVVSLETIEHVDDPVAFLRAIRDIVKSNGIIVLSCPNDWWYYPGEHQSNPYHRRKHHFEEFQELAETELGLATGWYVGGAAVGYCNLALERIPVCNPDTSQLAMLQEREVAAAILPAEYGKAPSLHDASYFIGVWGPVNETRLDNVALLPFGMDAFVNSFFKSQPKPEAGALQARMQSFQRTLTVLTAKCLGDSAATGEQTRLLTDTLLEENNLLQEQLVVLDKERNQLRAQVANLCEQVTTLRIAAHRYYRLQRLVPYPVRQWVKRIVHAVSRGRDV
jgi:2-polyprenyl-3-methyl-5-hydroxy-6-metoxy-1,4-benzoquinol methylase